VTTTAHTPTPEYLRQDACRLWVYASADHHWLGTRHEGWWDAFDQVWVLPVPRRSTRLKRLLSELRATGLTCRAAPRPLRDRKLRPQDRGTPSDSDQAQAPVAEVAAAGLLTHRQMRQMVSSCPGHTPEGVRDRALVLVCWELMATAQSLQAVDVDHLLPHRYGLQVQVSGRRVSLPHRAEEQVCPVRALHAYLDLREQDHLVRGPLWLHAAARSDRRVFLLDPLSTSEVSSRLNGIARTAGLPGSRTAAGLRHGAIAAAAAAGAPEPWLAAHSGMPLESATLRDLVALGRAAAEPVTDPWSWRWP
jgi:hypothetical protein